MTAIYQSDYCILDERIPLFTTIEKGLYKRVESLIRDNDINQINDDGTTPLYTAVKKGSRNLCTLLLKFGADPNIPDLNGRTPLHLAVRNKNRGIVKLLIQYHADVNQKDDDDIAPIFIAVKTGHRKIFDLLFKARANIDFSDSQGKTLLHHAISANHCHLAKKLLKNNYALVNKTTEHNITPLYMATKNGKTKLCKLLLDFAADPDIPDAFGTAPLHLASQENRYELAKLLLKNYANVNKKTMYGATPIYLAAKYANRKMCQLLLDYNANPSSEDSDGISPLHFLVSRHLYKTTELLLQNKANPNHVTKNGISPLLIAARHGHKPLCELLLKFGADANISDRNGNAPLNFAMWRNEKGVIKNFRQKVLNTLSCFRYFFCSNAHINPPRVNKTFVGLFLKWGANPNCVNKRGYSPLHAGIARKNSKLVRLLLTYDADPNFRAENRSSALLYSWRWADMKFFKILLSSCTKTIDENLLRTGLNNNYKLNSNYNAFYCVLAKHIIKLKIAGLLMHEDTQELVLDDYLDRFQEECMVEMTAMKEERICNFHAFSMSDLLTKTSEELVEYLRKETCPAVFNVESMASRYPIYEDFIRWNLKRAKRRKAEIDEFESVLYRVPPLMPKRQVDLIINRVSNEEQRRSVCQSKVKTGPLLLRQLPL